MRNKEANKMNEAVKQILLEQIEKYKIAWQYSNDTTAVNKQVKLVSIYKDYKRGFCTVYEALKMMIDICED